MAQIAKLEFEFDSQSSAEGFYKVFKNKPYIFPKACPNMIKDYQLIEGAWDSVGSVRKVTFITGEKIIIYMFTWTCIYTYIMKQSFL